MSLPGPSAKGGNKLPERLIKLHPLVPSQHPHYPAPAGALLLSRISLLVRALSSLDSPTVAVPKLFSPAKLYKDDSGP